METVHGFTLSAGHLTPFPEGSAPWAGDSGKWRNQKGSGRGEPPWSSQGNNVYSGGCACLSCLCLFLSWIESFSFAQKAYFPNNDGARITLALEFSFEKEYDLTRKKKT